MSDHVQKLFQIELDPGDRVVAATYFEGYVLVITEQGCVYKITRDGRYT